MNARNGSGGVCLFVKNDLLNLFNVDILDNSYEGILWVSFKHKTSSECFNICVCYLPPHGSSRYVNVHDFYDKLLTNIYEYQHLGQFIICGDFNSRIGDMPDHIEGVDSIPSRNVVDFTKNSYGEYLCKFLIDSNCCILNGRQYNNNDFTFVSTRGRSVVDYFIVPYENLEKCNNFKVFRPSDVFNPTNGVESKLIPDHSIIACEYTLQGLGSATQDGVTNSTLERKFKKFNLSNIPLNFCAEDETRQVLEALIENECDNYNQSRINNIYDEFCSVVKNEMQAKLPHKDISIKLGQSNKRRRLQKPWWNDELQILWNNMCDSEKAWLKCKNRQKQQLKHIFVQKRKLFDKLVQRRKRTYWFEMQNEILYNASNNQNEFWKSIGRVGIRDNRRNEIPMEIVDQNGSVITDSNTVFDKWRSDFCDLLNPNDDEEPDFDRIDVMQNADNITDEHSLDRGFSLLDVQKVVCNLKNNRATGFDEIPGEVLKNGSVISFLHKLCNVCYETGKIPEIWYKSVISPIPKCSTSDPRDPLSYRGIAITPVVYKVYCSLLNDRIKTWSEDNKLIFEGQNGFRKGRSTSYKFSYTNNRNKEKVKIIYLLCLHRF